MPGHGLHHPLKVFHLYYFYVSGIINNFTGRLAYFAKDISPVPLLFLFDPNVKKTLQANLTPV